MKKILMIVLMTVFTGLVAFADVPRKLEKLFDNALDFYSHVVNDFQSKNIDLNGGYYQGETSEVDFYQIKVVDNVEEVIIVTKTYIYGFDIGRIKGLNTTVASIAIYNDDDILFAKKMFFEEDDIVYEYFQDYVNRKLYQRS